MAKSIDFFQKVICCISLYINQLSVANIGRPLGLPGSVAQACTDVFPQAVRSAGKIESNAVFQKSPHTYGVRKNRTAILILPFLR